MRVLVLAVTLAACGGEAPPPEPGRSVPTATAPRVSPAAPAANGGPGAGRAPCQAAECNDDSPWKDFADPARAPETAAALAPR